MEGKGKESKQNFMEQNEIKRITGRNIREIEKLVKENREIVN